MLTAENIVNTIPNRSPSWWYRENRAFTASGESLRAGAEALVDEYDAVRGYGFTHRDILRNESGVLSEILTAAIDAAVEHARHEWEREAAQEVEDYLDYLREVDLGTVTIKQIATAYKG